MARGDIPLKRIAVIIIQLVVYTIAFLTYVVNLRPNLEKMVGSYGLGLIEGGLLLSIIYALFTYLLDILYTHKKGKSRK